MQWKKNYECCLLMKKKSKHRVKCFTFTKKFYKSEKIYFFYQKHED